MLSEGGGDPVDGGLQRRPQSEAQGFIRRVAQTAPRLGRFARGVRELKVAVHRLQHKRSHLPQHPPVSANIGYIHCASAHLLQREHAAEDAG